MALFKNINDFVVWNKIKIWLHFRPKIVLYFKEREIWWASLGVNIGYETDGKHYRFERPILIIRVFSRDSLWILPLTSKYKIGKYYYPLNFSGGNNSVVMLSQLRLISSRRLLRKIGMISNNDFNLIRDKLRDFI